MIIKNYSFSLSTSKREEFIEISPEISDFVKKSGVVNGFCKIFVPHTTAAVTINENADIDVERDMISILRKAVPKGNYLHSEGNSDAHLKSSLVGCTMDVLVDNRRILLGRWQGIYFCEFDGPRTRKVYVQVIGE